MTLTDFQLGVVDEVTYGTAVTVSRFFEYESENITDSFMRTQSAPLRTGSAFQRSDRFTPWYGGAAGTVQLAVMSKGFGFWLKHMMGAVSTSGPAETSVYTHTGDEGDLLGDSFTLQLNRPLNPDGTDLPFTFEGGKVASWTLANAVDGNLLCDLALDFEQVTTATALAAVSYPSGMDNLTWAGGKLTIGGTDVDVTEVSIACNNGLKVDRRFIRQNTDKKEPVSLRREASFSFTAEFDSETQRDRAAAAVRSNALASFVGTWRGPTLLGSTLYPQLEVTIPAARFDDWQGAVAGPDAIMQQLSGVGLWDGSNSPITLDYQTADATP